MAELIETVEIVRGGFSFLEGPRWHDGRLYVSDMHVRAVYAIEPDGKTELVVRVPNQPSGLGFAPDGALLVVSMQDSRLLRYDGNELTELADLSPYTTGWANDMIVDAQGRAYIGNFGFDPAPDVPVTAASLVRVDPDGRVQVAAKDLVFPNGAVISPDGTQLIVAETFAGRIAAFDIGPDGDLSGRREWASVSPPPTSESLGAVAGELAVLPDGLAIDAEGAVWMADAKGSGATRVREGGEVVGFAPSGDLSVYAVALGGPDGKSLYLCAAPPFGTSDLANERGSVLLRMRVDVPAVEGTS